MPSRTQEQRRRRAELADAATGIGQDWYAIPPLRFPDPIPELTRCGCGDLVQKGEEHTCSGDSAELKR